MMIKEKEDLEHLLKNQLLENVESKINYGKIQKISDGFGIY